MTPPCDNPLHKLRFLLLTRRGRAPRRAQTEVPLPCLPLAVLLTFLPEVLLRLRLPAWLWALPALLPALSTTDHLRAGALEVAVPGLPCGCCGSPQPWGVDRSLGSLQSWAGRGSRYWCQRTFQSRAGWRHLSLPGVLSSDFPSPVSPWVSACQLGLATRSSAPGSLPSWWSTLKRSAPSEGQMKVSVPGARIPDFGLVIQWSSYYWVWLDALWTCGFYSTSRYSSLAKFPSQVYRLNFVSLWSEVLRAGKPLVDVTSYLSWIPRLLCYQVFLWFNHPSACQLSSLTCAQFPSTQKCLPSVWVCSFVLIQQIHPPPPPTVKLTGTPPPQKALPCFRSDEIGNLFGVVLWLLVG
jgi:hypothetical protein